MTASNEHTMDTTVVPLSATSVHIDTITPSSPAPKQVKGGVFAAADIELVKDALSFYAKNNDQLTGPQSNQIANLMHRLSSRI